MTVDFKTSRPRERDPEAVKLAALDDVECASCGRRTANGDHVLPKDRGGDDRPDNIVGLCGSGTMGCHGAKHGNPYTDEDGRRWTHRDVMTAIGQTLKTRRRDVLLYLTLKLTYEGSKRFLRDTYWLDLGADDPEETVPDARGRKR